MKTTVGQILVNDALPPRYRDYGRVLTKSETDKMLADIGQKDPALYREISHKLMQLGRHAAYEEGVTLRLDDLMSPVDKSELIKHVAEQERRINADKTSSDEAKHEAKELLYGEVHDALKKMTMEATSAKENPLAIQVMSKARGNVDQLTGILTTPGVYQDQKGRTIPVFIKRSYAEGLDPHEYYAASFGARLGVLSTKLGTRKAGYLGKLFSAAAVESVVTEDDCGTPYGIPVKADDNDNLGAVLAQDVAGYKAGDVISKPVLDAIRAKKVDDIVVRSPITCGSKRGICKHCAGQRENGKFPEIGYNLGTNAASALAERLAQGSLNLKHSGKKAKGTSAYSGFDVIRNLATVPEAFPDAATVAEHDGTVESVKEAPQGGYDIMISGQPHYVAPGIPVTVKEGDVLEAGDALSEGIVNPADVVRLKGIGEGRRYFADRMTKAMTDSNYEANRRNVEVLARSMVDHITIDDPDAGGQHLPGDTVTYQSWAYGYKPRKDSQQLHPKKAIGQYLEAPALHYTIGTRITRKVADQLGQYGVDSVISHPQPVGVVPEMVSVVRTPEFSGDWMARLNSSYLKTRLLEDVQAGATSNAHGINPIPSMAKGVEFGQQKGKEFTY